MVVDEVPLAKTASALLDSLPVFPQKTSAPSVSPRHFFYNKSYTAIVKQKRSPNEKVRVTGKQAPLSIGEEGIVPRGKITKK